MHLGPIRRTLRWCAWLILCIGLAGCAAPQKKTFSDFAGARVASILVLPPINDTPEVQAPASLLAQVTQPLADAGYYVMPVALVRETFRQNGMEVAPDIHAVPADRLRAIFGADAVLYLRITDYGTRYLVLASSTVVSAQARLVDLRTGALLWSSEASASSEETRGRSGSSVSAVLVGALIQQVMDSVTDNAHQIAGLTSRRLLSPASGGLPYGPLASRARRR